MHCREHRKYPEFCKEDASQQSVLCGHTGLASLAETPVSTGIKEDPHSPDENPGQEDTHKSVNTVEIALGDEGDHAGLTVQSEQRAIARAAPVSKTVNAKKANRG